MWPSQDDYAKTVLKQALHNNKEFAELIKNAKLQIREEVDA
jgi:hypothetical protein